MGIFNIIKEESHEDFKNLTETEGMLLLAQKAEETKKIHDKIHMDLLVAASYWQNNDIANFKKTIEGMAISFNEFEESLKSFDEIYKYFH